MNKSSRIYIAGHTGLVGSAITRSLTAKGYETLIMRTQSELDLTNQAAVDSFFLKEKPEYVILAAALVGGIVANNTYRADFIYHNIMIQSNVIHACWKYKVKKLLFLGSTCIYPKNAPQPLKEEYLLTSSLEYTNEPYAIAKIAGLKMCESFNLQYGTNFIAVMPTNLYGPGDNFDLERSHVLPALLRKIHLGKCLEESNWLAIRRDMDKYPVESVNGKSDIKAILGIMRKYGICHQNDYFISPERGVKDSKVKVELWGSGKPLREFMYSEDMADACIFIMENINVKDIIRLSKSLKVSGSNIPQFINVGTGEELSIQELAFKIKKLLEFKGDIIFDSSKPDGTLRKITDISMIRALGFSHKNNLDLGLVKVRDGYLL